MDVEFVERRALSMVKRIRRTTAYLARHGVVPAPMEYDGKMRAFISRAMVDGVDEDTQRTMDFHQRCVSAGIPDGRVYWSYLQEGRIVGLSGYHFRIWDATHVVWGGWYVAEPELPAMAKIGILLDTLRHLVEETTFEHLYIETLANTEDSNILAIYRSLMCTEMCRFPGFYGKSSDMVVMKLELGPIRELWNSSSKSKSLPGRTLSTGTPVALSNQL